MINDTEPKRRGCCPPEAAIYRAVNEDPRIKPIVGTAREIADRLEVIPGHIRSLARSGRATKSGWTIDIVTPTELTGKRHERKEYIAECPGEDPIVGPVSEIAALTGLSESDVTYLIRYQGKSRKGWKVRRGRKPIIVEARRGDVRIAGTPETVGRALGYTAGYIRRLSTQHRRPAGKEWEIVEIMRPGEHRGGKTARIYAAERDGEAVSGTAVELAAVLGVVPETVRELERGGRRSRKGWTVRRTDRGFDITAGPAVE